MRSRRQKQIPTLESTQQRSLALLFGLLLAAGILVYANSLAAPFAFDDFGAIQENATIRSLSASFDPPREQPTAGRPLVNLSFAINYALGGLDVSGYRVVNLALHLACALLLFAIVRRTLELPRLRDTFGSQSTPLAFVVAGLWMLHPLNSEVVDYTSQRTESMMALCYLLTMYCALREADGAFGKWTIGAVLACAAGMACKETMATAPFAVVLFDLAFRFDSARAAFERRRGLYVGLAFTWLVTGVLLAGAPRTQTAGFSTSVSLWTYLLNQTVMLAHYLRLAVWPNGLVLNYGRPVALTLSAVLPQAILIVALLGASFALWLKDRRLGFAGLFFFLTLAPTSLVPIVTEVGAERRMYLPLIAVVAVWVLGVFALGRRMRPARVAGLAAAAIVALAFSATVFARNREYATELTLARTNLERWPSSVAEAMAGVAAGGAGLHDEAITHFENAVAHGSVDANYSLAIELMEGGHPEQAIPKLEALLSHPDTVTAAVATAGRRAIADAYLAQNDLEHARAAYVTYLEQRPTDSEALDRLGRTQATLEQHKDAAATFGRLVDVAPANSEAWNSLVIELLRAGDVDVAEQKVRQALVLNANDARMVDLLGRVLLARNQVDEAARQFERALQIEPQYAPSLESLKHIRRRGRPAA